MSKGFKNVNLVLPDKVIKGSLSFEGSRIANFDTPEEAIIVNEDVYVCPGFIDEHIHGADGKDVMDASEDSLSTMAKALMVEGVVAFLATTMTESKEKIFSSCRAVNSYMASPKGGAEILGLHLEGPFISPLHKGAQDALFILKPDAALLNEFVEASGNNVRLVTFAYENDEGSKFLDYCLKHGITPSIGHSDCSSAVFKTGIKNGLTCVTHLFNAQRGFHHREPGITGEALYQDGVKTEIICDTYHVCPDALGLMFKCKKKEDIIMISDSCELKYLPNGSKGHLGSQEIFASNGVAKLQDGTIAASMLKLNDGLRNVACLARGYSYSDLINLVSLNPAKNLHIDGDYGSIEKGKIASFAVLDSDFNVIMTVIKGRVAYRAK
jgi:N-acetylglucosamine-6-phosphate deacetylase